VTCLGLAPSFEKFLPFVRIGRCLSDKGVEAGNVIELGTNQHCLQNVTVKGMTPTFASWRTGLVIGKKAALTLLIVAPKAKTESGRCMAATKEAYARPCEMRIES
jgi:hypothetical protein